MTRELRRLAASLLLAANVVVHFDVMEIVVYMDPGTSVEAPAEFVAREACGLLKSMRLALPVPYRLQWSTRLGTGGVVPDESKFIEGLLTSCDEKV